MQWKRFIAMVVLGMASGLVGCQKQITQIDSPLPVASQDYQIAFDATVEALRELNFIVDRQDRRFGVITTRPRIAGSIFEPWQADNNSLEQVGENTMNHRRRIVRVEMAQVETTGDYTLDVEVLVEQQQRSSQQLHTAATRQISFRGRSGGTRLGELSRDVEVFWRQVGRDELMENRILGLIQSRLSKHHIALPGTAVGTEEHPRLVESAR